MSASLILFNANVLTLNPERPRAELVAMNGDKITLASGNEELARLRGPETRVIDCQGKTIVPGFNDAHCHIFSFLRKLLSLDLSPSVVGSIAEIKKKLHEQTQKTPKGKWLTGTGYSEFYLAEKRHPNRWDLDEVAPEHPVLLVHQSLHACVLNSLALLMAGINEETPEPQGKVFDRDVNSGELSGVLFEMLGYIRAKVLPPLSEEELRKGVKLASEHYLSHGITSLQDLSANNDFSRWQAFVQLKERDMLKSRLYMFFGTQARPQFKEAGLVTGSGDTNLRLGGIKIMLTEATGRPEPSEEELKKLILDSSEAGYQISMHAVSEDTVEEAITALEYLKIHSAQGEKCPRIAHCSECPPRLLRRLSRLRPVIVTQPPFLYFSGDRYLKTVPPDRHRWLYRIGSFLKGGLTVAGSSDSPVVPVNPLIGIYAASTRKTESGQELEPAEKTSPEEALKLYTQNAAYASFEENLKGSISPGKLADMVVLSDDPLKPPPDRIKEIRVLMTVIGGRVAWEV